MKLLSWNVNGLRAHKKNFMSWLEDENADVVCLQEIKIGQLHVDANENLRNPLRYSGHWHFAKRPGYSGLV